GADLPLRSGESPQAGPGRGVRQLAGERATGQSGPGGRPAHAGGAARHGALVPTSGRSAGGPWRRAHPADLSRLAGPPPPCGVRGPDARAVVAAGSRRGPGTLPEVTAYAARMTEARRELRGSSVVDGPVSASALRRALRRATDGRTLDQDEAAVLLAARGEALVDLLAVAGQVRDAGLRAADRPGVVTYSRKVFIPLTRLCRDRCHYCTFATVPGRVAAPYLGRDEVRAIARAGAAAGCKEALFTLGDRPELRWPQARTWLDQRGFRSTLDYLRACAVAVLEETGLLPHLNPGVLSWEELQRLRPVAPSMGMMLETTSHRLFAEPGNCHYGSPDKEPAVRLRVLEDAGRVGVPFTTGILVGSGETRAERAESLFAIRKVAQTYGHIQEVIVQNFRAKPDTAMRRMPDADLAELAATVAVARLVLGPRARLQAPPNLIGDEYDLL